ncbi:AraC family transcriptional regulator [Flagellimonas sp. S3867]|uniref:helix-turn-helix domain-containing protein n=1 Tax=Flagellimonas sp. S3867 TaxID=2768063 RepID=UPI0016825BE7|nr:helix-turn-helix domain-containing protein [Flagellimonas sp. S3867]
MDFTYLLFLVLAFQSLLIAILFVFRKSNTKYTNILWAFFLLITSWMFILTVLFWTQLLFNGQRAHFVLTYYIPLSSFAPLFFFYIRKIITDKSISLKKDFWHFIPLIYSVTAINPFYFFLGTNKMNLFLNGEESVNAYQLFPFGYFDAILVLIMVTYGITIVNKYWKTYKGNGNLRTWTRAIILVFLGCVFSFTLYYGLYFFGFLSSEQDYGIILFLPILALIITIFAFNYNTIFNDTLVENVIPSVKYKKTGLSKNYSLELKGKLEALMLNDKPHLNSELRLDNLAELLGASRHHASQIINEYFDSNFFDFINSHRVAEAVELLEIKKKEVTLSEVGYLAGFNNTVSFNKAFKKNTGLTPSKYREQLLDTNRVFNY